MIGVQRGDAVRAMVAQVRASLPEDAAAAAYRDGNVAERARIERAAAAGGLTVGAFLARKDRARAAETSHFADRQRFAEIARRAR